MTSKAEAVRFILVGLFSELTYLFLFVNATSLGFHPSGAVVIVGSLCTILNAQLHARISFRVRNTVRKTINYLRIQVFCLCVATVLAYGLKSVGVLSWLIGMTTGLIWTFMSFFLARRLYHGHP